ncbi:MAG: hypothetical protein V8T10_07380 [Merdibacter sp.]
MLKVRGLKKRFGDLQVLKGIDLDVHEGDVISILGPSGSGRRPSCAAWNFSNGRMRESYAG